MRNRLLPIGLLGDLIFHSDRRFEMMLRIIADEREKASGVPEALRSLGVAVEYRVLDVADYGGLLCH